MIVSIVTLLGEIPVFLWLWNLRSSWASIYVLIKKKKWKRKNTTLSVEFQKNKYQNRRNRGITNTPNTQIHDAYFPRLVQAFE